MRGQAGGGGELELVNFCSKNQNLKIEFFYGGGEGGGGGEWEG